MLFKHTHKQGMCVYVCLCVKIIFIIYVIDIIQPSKNNTRLFYIAHLKNVKIVNSHTSLFSYFWDCLLTSSGS